MTPNQLVRKFTQAYKKDNGMTPAEQGESNIHVDKAARAAGSDVVTVKVPSFWGFPQDVQRDLDRMVELVTLYTGVTLTPVNDYPPRKVKIGRGSDPHIFTKQYRIAG